MKEWKTLFNLHIIYIKATLPACRHAGRLITSLMQQQQLQP